MLKGTFGLQYFAYIYIEVVDFISISIALYGLVVLYTLLKKRLMGKRPLTKFICIKIIVGPSSLSSSCSDLALASLLQVALTYYQAFLFSALVSQGLIKPNGTFKRSACLKILFLFLRRSYASVLEQNQYRGWIERDRHMHRSEFRFLCHCPQTNS